MHTTIDKFYTSVGRELFEHVKDFVASFAISQLKHQQAKQKF